MISIEGGIVALVFVWFVTRLFSPPTAPDKYAQLGELVRGLIE